MYYFNLDSLEAFFVNSYQNGATSWIPKELPPNVRIVVTLNSGPVVTRKGGSGADREVQRFAASGIMGWSHVNTGCLFKCRTVTVRWKFH